MRCPDRILKSLNVKESELFWKGRYLLLLLLLPDVCFIHVARRLWIYAEKERRGRWNQACMGCGVIYIEHFSKVSLERDSSSTKQYGLSVSRRSSSWFFGLYYQWPVCLMLQMSTCPNFSCFSMAFRIDISWQALIIKEHFITTLHYLKSHEFNYRWLR